jgi:hypothetical protein
MATPQRLPIVNQDDGTWGDIIRQYIQKEHYDDGTDNAVNGGHQKITEPVPRRRARHLSS